MMYTTGDRFCVNTNSVTITCTQTRRQDTRAYIKLNTIIIIFHKTLRTLKCRVNKSPFLSVWSSSGCHCFAFLTFLILVRVEVGQVSLELNHLLKVSWLTDFQHLWLYTLSEFRTTISSIVGGHLSELQLSKSPK